MLLYEEATKRVVGKDIKGYEVIPNLGKMKAFKKKEMEKIPEGERVLRIESRDKMALNHNKDYICWFNVVPYNSQGSDERRWPVSKWDETHVWDVAVSHYQTKEDLKRSQEALKYYYKDIYGVKKIREASVHDHYYSRDKEQKYFLIEDKLSASLTNTSNNGGTGAPFEGRVIQCTYPLYCLQLFLQGDMKAILRSDMEELAGLFIVRNKPIMVTKIYTDIPDYQFEATGITNEELQRQGEVLTLIRNARL